MACPHRYQNRHPQKKYELTQRYTKGIELLVCIRTIQNLHLKENLNRHKRNTQDTERPVCFIYRQRFTNRHPKGNTNLPKKYTRHNVPNFLEVSSQTSKTTSHRNPD